MIQKVIQKEKPFNAVLWDGTEGTLKAVEKMLLGKAIPHNPPATIDSVAMSIDRELLYIQYSWWDIEDMQIRGDIITVRRGHWVSERGQTYPKEAITVVSTPKKPLFEDFGEQ